MEFQNRRILLVDDDRRVTKLVGWFLETRGRFQVLVENDSELALEKARAFRPDVIVLDVDMPRLDGGDVAIRLGADRDLAKVPIIFMSSLITAAEQGERGGHRYLSKPAPPADLLACIHSLLN
jgi:DNA-binding response OmpR family regulator